MAIHAELSMKTTHVAALAFLFLTAVFPRLGWSQQIESQEVRAARAQAWVDAAVRAQRSQDLQHAIENYEKALAAFRDLHDRLSEALVLHNLGAAYRSTGRTTTAIGLYEQALKIERETGDDAGEGGTLNSMGLAYATLGQYTKAIDLYDAALTIRRKVGDKDGQGDTLSNLGVAYRRLSDYPKAIEFYEQALAIHHEVGNRGREGTILNNLGAAYLALSQYGKAIGFLERALPILRQSGDRVGEAHTLGNAGEAYRSLGQYEKAIGFFEQALTITREIDDLAGVGTSLNDLGATYASLEQYAKAIGFYEQALTIQRQVGDREEEAIVLNNLGETYRSKGEYAKAVDFYMQALAIANKIGDRAGEGMALHNLGHANASMGQYAKAIGFYQQALTIEREIGDLTVEATALHNLTVTLILQRKLRLAVLFGKRAVNTYQQIRQNLAGLDERTRKTYVESNEDTYRGVAELLLMQDRIAEAQQVLNLLKEEEFFDFVRRDSSQASSLAGRVDLTRTEAEWDRRYNEIADRLTALGHERGELVALRTRTAEQDARIASLDRDLTIAGEAFQKFLAQLDTEASQQKLSKEKLNQVKDSEALMETLRELGSGTVAIYTLVTEDKLRLILITPDVMKTAEAAITRTDLNRKIVAFRQSLENPRSDPRPLARELYQLILGPVEKDLAGAKAATIMWSLDGAMRYLPVAALYDCEHYVIERFRNLVFTPASNANLKDVPAVQWRALGLGVSKAHEGFGALPGAQKELEAIIHDEATNTHGVLPGAIQLDDAFTRQSMISALHQRYRVVHIASHFRFKPGNETDSYLLLGDGGHLSLADVGTMENPFGGVDLLTLSACDTASGGTGANGKEVEGFAVLAQRKGAKAVIATLWPVADASTNELMQSFYRIRESKEGMSKVEALQQAQLALLHGSTYSHPYYWAPFILIGNSQ
jgi:CHAT domain-containing protein/Tfp pilus assembly protein PilF